MLRRRTVLALMLVGVIPAFAFVNSLVATARNRREAIAVDWAHRGDDDLAQKRPDAAADDFRTAEDYARDRGAYRLQLATALVAGDRLVEAQAQLDALWNERPGDGIVNLLLARIAAKESRVADAVRYYHAAIDGSWTGANPVAVRRDTRLELAQFLLARGDSTQAQVELVALAADPPPSPDVQVTIASLLADTGADNRALTLLAHVVQTNPKDARAASLAGSIAMRLGDYRGARAFLERARAAGGLDADGTAQLDTVTRVLALDPDARGLSARERLRRTVRAFEIASAALERCASDTLDATREQRDRLARQVTPRALAGDPDAVDDTLAFAASAIEAVRSACGEGSGDERALHLVF